MGFSTSNSVYATICEVLSFQFTVSYYILGYFLFNSLWAIPLRTTFFPILCRLLSPVLSLCVLASELFINSNIFTRGRKENYII